MAPPPSSAAVASAVGRSTSPIATRAPCATSARAVAAPMPRPPPVMTTTLPARERSCLAMQRTLHGGDAGVIFSEVRAAGEVRAQRPDVAADERAAAAAQLEPGLQHHVHRPVLQRVEEV